MTELQKTVLTESELADSLGLSAWTVRRWRLSEGLPVIQIGRRFLYRRDAVLAWLESMETAGAADDVPGEVGSIRRVGP